MQTDLLRTFVTVADLRSFTRAGEMLGRTQPAISLQIKRLEDIACASLFERDSTSFRLTPVGEVLAIYARQILCLHDEALSRLLQRTVTGAVRVGLPNDFAVTLLPEVLVDFISRNPGVRLDVSCDISLNLLRGLHDGHHDVIVAMTAEQAAPAAAKLWAERLAWVGGIAPRIDDVRPLPLIVYPEGCIYRARMTEALSRAGIPWQITCTTASLASLQAAVRAGLGLTVLSASTVPAGLAVRPPEAGFPGLADATVGLYYARETLSDAAQHLVNFIIRKLDAAHGHGRSTFPVVI
ncbi:LysR substrate-binding domain-containing protein [Acidiphilium iwatense]|uniref:LysR substrate-binding domain-containing protein n=1 Tax=Acidiphilium iwatense TaxID=768198 RepID=A0ABS9E1Z7_9PROT|nr:LysR substrate-binding domain-containing protein [Acidiphilium iwatense]MCF3948378.1 LysR substrate-binding domain-containing protein [Acidiphilium iwatense]